MRSSLSCQDMEFWDDVSHEQSYGKGPWGTLILFMANSPLRVGCPNSHLRPGLASQELTEHARAVLWFQGSCHRRETGAFRWVLFVFLSLPSG